MKQRTLTARSLRALAIAAIIATPVVVVSAAPASAGPVGDQDALYDDFTDGGVTQIDLTASIVIDSTGDNGCDQMTRPGGASSLVIDGHGFSITKAPECEGERIFRSHADNPITFQNVTVSGGVKFGGEGGALKADGPVNVIDSTFSNNQALECQLKNGASQTSDPEAAGFCGTPNGGAIFSEGSIVISGSLFDNNHADNAGGGVFSEADVTVTGSQFSGNSAGTNWSWGSGGGFLALGGADVADSQFSGNSAGCEVGCDGSGGGFWAKGAAQVVNSTLSNNSAGCDFGCQGLGGGFYASGYSQASFAGDSVGALGADPGNIIVSLSTFNGNTATCGVDLETDNEVESAGHRNDICGSGGGFSAYKAALVAVSQSTFTGNAATCTFDSESLPAAQGGSGDVELCGVGGGFFTRRADEVTVDSSTFDANSALFAGGAIMNGGAGDFGGLICAEGEGCGGGSAMTITNSTVTANTSGFVFGAITSLREGDTVALVNDTIVGNVLDGSALDMLGELGAAAVEPELGANITAASLTSFGTIVTGGHGLNIAELIELTGNCLVETSTSEGYNFTDDETCGFTAPTDFVATPNDPSLLPLGAYGGPTNTMRPTGEIDGASGVLVSLSPVVDQIPADQCRVDVDQRGVSRPQEIKALACDIGSVEITAAEITVAGDIVAITPRLTG